MTGRAVTGEICRLRAHAIRRDLQVLGCDWRRVVAMRTPRAPLITHARMTMNALQDTKQPGKTRDHERAAITNDLIRRVLRVEDAIARSARCSNV